MERYVIEIVNFKTRTRFFLKAVMNGIIIPVNGKSYKTEQEAREAADAMGIQILRVGTHYQLI